MNEEKLKQAISLYKQGNKSQAANLLGEIVRQDPNNSVAWYGMALSLDEPDKKIYCLKKVVSLDPSHEKAQQLLENLQPEKKLVTPNKQQGAAGNYQPQAQNSMPKDFIKKSLDESTPIEKKTYICSWWHGYFVIALCFNCWSYHMDKTTMFRTI